MEKNEAPEMIKNRQKRYVFGPIFSRRLGRSLGIDLFQRKTCNYDCAYCEVGKTKLLTNKRQNFTDVPALIEEIREAIEKGSKIDFISFAGSGEPMLEAQMGEIIHQVRKITKIPIAIITNGSLFYQPQARKDVMEADLIMPSLDFANDLAFKQMNNPHPDLTAEKVIQGLIDLRKEFLGRIFLEVFVLPGRNTDDEHLQALKVQIARIQPDKVQINTIDRKPAEAELEPASRDCLCHVRDVIDFEQTEIYR